MQSQTPTSGETPTLPARPLKIAFINPFNLFDVSSGAALSMRTMLEQLARRGVSCHALTACCFDAPPGDRLPALLRGKGLLPSAKIKGHAVPVWQGSASGVAYTIVQAPSQQRNQMTAIEELIFRDAVRAWLTENRPDVVLVFGGLLLDIEIQRCTRHAGAIVAFYLPNASYGRPETFAHVDIILTNSDATKEYY
ncbi:MAG: hypothetical protein ACHP7O_13430, partial [Burkholderiales bacterium]